MPAPKMKLVAAASLRDDPENARDHSAEQVEHVAGLIRRFGWTRPIFVDVSDQNTIVVGHGARQAALALYEAGEDIYAAPGKERGGAKFPKGKVPIVDVSGWTEDERRAVNLSDNRAGEMSTWNPELLAAQLSALESAEFDLPDIGFDQAALADLVGGADGSGAAPGKAAPTGELEDSTFNYVEQFAVIVRCKDAKEQEERFKTLTKTYGVDDCKVVVV